MFSGAPGCATFSGTPTAIAERSAARRPFRLRHLAAAVAAHMLSLGRAARQATQESQQDYSPSESNQHQQSHDDKDLAD
jgi:hypothetical protein